MKYAAVLFGMSLVLLAAPQLDLKTGVYTTSEGVECPLSGKLTGSEGSKELNPRKNRFDFPKNDDIDPDVSLAAMLSPGDDTGRFDSSKAATISGFVVKVKSGEKESCNCGANKPIDKDTHIMLGLSSTALKTQCVVVEVTPRLRLLMAKNGSDWSTEALGKKNGPNGILGKWVKVTGWLLFDSIHADDSENTRPGHANNQRATAWEIHPVTKIEILPGPPEGTELHPAVLSAMQKAHAMHARRDPNKRDEIEKRIKAHLSKFNEEDLKEKKAEMEDDGK
jgi:hypothetical protein